MSPKGDYLGAFTSELKPGDHIVEFAAAGPKNYGYRTSDGKVECKIRGFTLSTREQAQLNFDLLKANVIHEVTAPLEEPRVIHTSHSHKIKRDADTKLRNGRRNQAILGGLRQARDRRSQHFHSFPYGYTRAEFEDVDMENIEILVGL